MRAIHLESSRFKAPVNSSGTDTNIKILRLLTKLRTRSLTNTNSRSHKHYIFGRRRECRSPRLWSVSDVIVVQEPVIGLIKWLRPKGLKVCSYVEKCAEFKNQTLKKIGWYTKVLCATEYPLGIQYLKIALKWDTLAGLYFKPCYISSKMQMLAANNI